MRPTHTDMVRLLVAGLALWPAAAPAAEDPFAFFEAHIRPVLVEHCYPCHSAAQEHPKGAFRLDTRDGLLKGGASGEPAIRPGNASASRLIEALRYTNHDLQMPPKDKLPDALIDALAAWIDSGAPDPRTDTAPPPPAPSKDHWAFKPPVAAPSPPVQDTAWPRNFIDHFVLAKLEANGLRPAPAADRYTLARRAHFDLLGLPPSYTEVERFINDPDPAAFDQLVAGLLASPRHGERWARHWLDVARYADSKGYVYPEREEARFFHSHVYRDWVIAALNADMPYDQFLRYQIAGDQLSGPQGEDHRAALGFLTLGRRFLGVVHDIIDDRIDVVTRGALGLTMACARCHDHKFDPLTARDYYALYGVFAGSSERIVRVPGDPGDPEKRAAFEAEWRARLDAFNYEFSERKEELAARLRTQTDRYLDAALRASTFPTDEFYEIRGPDDLNPTIVWQWRRYLDQQPVDHPVWGPWRAAETTGDFTRALDPARFNPLLLAALRERPVAAMADIAAAYGGVFLRVNQQWLDRVDRAHRHDLPDPQGFDDPALEQIRAVLYAPGAPVEAPKGPTVDIEWYFDEPTRIALAKRSKALETLLLTDPGAPPHALVLEDKPQQRDPVIFKRGSAANKGDTVRRSFPEVLGGGDHAPFQRGSGRAELASAIAAPENPLTARVIVNRVWQWHFGEGLVRTVSDFGTRCDPPTHPELLDTLAVWFMDNGWSLKKLHQLILASATWQQGGRPAPENANAAMLDPENRLLWHFPPQRLDFESMRDALLAVSGTLDPQIGGKPVDLFTPPFPARRTLYGNIDRTFLQGAYRVFDFPNPDMHGPRRSETTVPQQALFLMNSPFLKDQARALADATGGLPDLHARVEALYRRVYQRPPAQADLQLAAGFIASVPEPPAVSPAPEPSPWQYGTGAYDPTPQRVQGFQPLPHFTGTAYQGGPAYPDSAHGWAQLTPTGGHPGNDTAHACIRRWTAPRDGTLAITGTLIHEPAEGDGVRAYIISSNTGPRAEYRVHASQTETAPAPFTVQAGETIDFLVDIAGTLNSDQFLWAPALTLTANSSPATSPVATGFPPAPPAPSPVAAGVSPAVFTYDANKDFAPPYTPPPVPMRPWDQYAQALLLSNAFAFID